jgi:hypothetical protein
MNCPINHNRVRSYTIILIAETLLYRDKLWIYYFLYIIALQNSDFEVRLKY